MRKSVCLSLTITVVIGSVFYSCKKNEANGNDCFPNASTSRLIIDKPATVKQQAGTFYLVEQSVIDTKLNPCNLPAEFQVDNLQVTISGNVKTTSPSNNSPCCTENFVITKITR